ncbi:hypothetical protein PENSTE_c022G00199 [Penicillium steckii]|uniref:DUF8035 domain-containing protein n=1 Tax=Penicillium steckii TaxID=303698 RepID=A0A1V6SSF6_9EURO|nr:hypothetical protein PENSTE_c022G00199 [Penicillium steckii]
MSRRAPPRYYYEEDDFEPEREIYPRPRRREPEFEDEVEVRRRRRSMPPPEDMERLRARERPPRDFMEESFAPPRERERMVMRRSRDEVEEDREFQREQDEIYKPSRRRRSHRPREIDEGDFIYEERERRRERRPRDVEEDFMIDEKERRHGRRSREIGEEVPILEERERRRERRPRDIDEDLIMEETERRRGRRPREIDEDDLIVEDRERRRERRPREIDEEDLLIQERGRYRGPLRREIGEEDMGFGDRERRRGPRPRDPDEEDLVIEEREKRRIHRPRRMSLEERMFEGDRRRGPRPREPLSEEEEIMIQEKERRERRRPRPDRDIEEEEVEDLPPRRRQGPPRELDTDRNRHPRERSLEEERDEPVRRSSESRRRNWPRSPQIVEEIVIGDRNRAVPPGGRSRRDNRIDEEIIMRWKDRPSQRERDEEDEDLRSRGKIRERHIPPEPVSEREPPGAFPIEEDEEFLEGTSIEEIEQKRSRSRSRRSPEIVSDPLEAEEVSIHKERVVHPPRDASPEPVRAPPIHQDVITHHRHIDHGYEGARLPRAPSPEVRSRRASFDEIDVHQRSSRGGRRSADDVSYKHHYEDEGEHEEEEDDESISPTSKPSIDFSNPWDHKKGFSSRKPPSLERENMSMSGKSSKSHGRRNLPRGFDLNKEIEEEEVVEVHEKPSIPPSTVLSKGTTDEWSAANTPTKIEAAEMSGALSVIEVAPKHAVEEELDIDIERDVEIGQQVEKGSGSRDERWTEITKELVVREAIERLGYEFEEARKHYYVFSFLEQRDIDELIELSDHIRSARRRRIREMQRERASLPPPPRPRRSSLVERLPMRPPRPMGERRVREREWIIDPRRSGRF